MEPPAIGYDAIDHTQSSVHGGAYPSSLVSASPGRWPKSTPTASTGIRLPGWCTTAARRGLPSASSADAGPERPAR